MSSILIIDDDMHILNALKGLLESYGYTAMTASNGMDGIESAKRGQPDLILADINMPTMNGFEVFQRLQETAVTQTIPLIFLSGRDDLDTMRKGMQVGANDYLTKPFEPEDLLNAINIRLKQREQLERKYESTLTLLRKNITYTLPHELRTPLTVILGYALMLQTDYETMASAEIGMFANEIAKASQRLHRVIENYLVYIQLELVAGNSQEIEAMRRHLVVADKVINKYAVEAVAAYKRSADLELELAPNLGLRISDENLGKIITEVADNSCRFSNAGTKIRILAYREENGVTIEIHDEGRGISQEQIAEIGAFMQFERGIYEQQGMGLGLSIAIKLCEVHNATLRIESEKDVGTQVIIQFRR